MNNPFRNRSQDHGRDQSDDWRGADDRYRAENRRHDEDRSWRTGGEGRGQRGYPRDDSYRSEAGASGYGYGQYERDDRGPDDARWGGGNYAAQGGADWAGGYGRQAQSAFGAGRSDFGGQGHRSDRGVGDYGRRATSYEAEGYAPGAQIWDQRDTRSRRTYQGGRDHSDFEPDYLHWREQQMSRFDDDYRDWRAEKRQKFSSDFDSWRTNRAANPIVGDVSDGGTGDQKDVKKS